VGKGTLVSAALKALPDLALSISATTRAPRGNDVDGVDYHFKTDEEFDELIAHDRLLEWAEVHGNRYGTLTEEVQKKLEGGQDLILEIDTQGAEQVRSRMADMVSIFIAPPSLEELRRRLESRGTEDKASVERRLRNAELEMQTKDRYNVVIINDDLKSATQELLAVIHRKGT
jgi:guanylate kinase